VSESCFTSKQRKKVRYMDEKSMEIGQMNDQNNRKAKGRKIGNKRRERRDCAATLSDLYPSTCLAWEALTGV